MRSSVGVPIEQRELTNRYLHFRSHHGLYQAWLVAALVRFALAGRAANAFAGSLWGDGGKQKLAVLLWSRACYNPEVRLAHESPAGGSS